MPPRRARDLQGKVRVAAPEGLPLITLPTGPIAGSTTAAKQDFGAVLQRFVPELTPAQVMEFNSWGLQLARDPDFNELLMTVVALIKTQGIEATLAYLRSQPGATARDLIFNSALLENARMKERIDLDIFRNKVKGTAGVFQCPRCGSRETVSAEKQTRSADEPMTIKITCIACGFNWKKG